MVVFAFRNSRVGLQVPHVVPPPRDVGAPHGHIQVELLDEVHEIAFSGERPASGIDPAGRSNACGGSIANRAGQTISPDFPGGMPPGCHVAPRLAPRLLFAHRE